MDRVGIVFISCCVLAALTAIATGNKEQPNAIDVKDVSFNTTQGFNVAALGVVVILIAIYATWW